MAYSGLEFSFQSAVELAEELDYIESSLADDTHTKVQAIPYVIDRDA